MTGRLIVIAAIACGMVGCSSLELEPLGLPLVSDEKPKELPSRMIPVWADTVLHRGGKAVRGFGGRVIFYGVKHDSPIEVDGSLIVYAWNDTGGARSETPDRKYAFRADALPKHYSTSKIGHSYSFWLPWDEANGETQHVTLVTRFISAAGGEVTSSAAHVVLPGPAEEVREPKEPKELGERLREKLQSLPVPETTSGIRQIGFERTSPSRVDEEDEDDSSTTTIDLPLHLAHGGDNIDLPTVEDRYSDRDDNRDIDQDRYPARRRASISASDLISNSEPEETDRTARHASRFSRRELPVQSWRLGPQFSSREKSQRARSMSRSGQNRLQRSDSLTVQQRILRDAAEAQAIRDEQNGRYEDAAQARE